MVTTKVEPAPRLPNTVFAASYLFAGVAALAIVSAISTSFAIPEFTYQSQRLEGDSAGALTALGLVAFALIATVFGGLCLLLALLDGRGSSVARVFTWVLGGLAVCFNIGLLVVGMFDSVPWYAGLTRIAATVTLLLTAGSIVLLALPGSQEYFRAAQLVRQQRRVRIMLPQPPWALRQPPAVSPAIPVMTVPVPPQVAPLSPATPLAPTTPPPTATQPTAGEEKSGVDLDNRKPAGDSQ